MDKTREHIEVTDLLDDFEHEKEVEGIEHEISEIDKKLQNIADTEKEKNSK